MSPPIWVLSMHQPWASLYVHGRKNIENRGWPPPRALSRQVICIDCSQPLERDPAGGWSRHLHGVHRSDTIDIGPTPFLLGIHAAKRFDHAALEQRLVVEEILHLPHPPGDVAGMLLGFVTITTGTHHASECACECEGRRWRTGTTRRTGVPCDLCNADGNLTAPLIPHDACSPWAQTGNVWHWVRTNPQPLTAPIPVTGRQRLWQLPAVAATLLPSDYLQVA